MGPANHPRRGRDGGSDAGPTKARAALDGSGAEPQCVILASLDDSRVAIAAPAVGLIQACSDKCTAYARERRAFGRSIGSYQAVAFRWADM